MTRSVVTAIEPVNTFPEQARRGIVRILSNKDYSPGARAGYLLREYGKQLEFSPRAKLLYLLLAGFMGADKKRPQSVCVSMAKLAEWLNCTPRSAQTAVRELTRSGPVPLLLEIPGRPGRVSEYSVVRDPFTIATQQAADTARILQRRRPAYLAGQFAAVREANEGQQGQIESRLTEVSKRQRWNTATRPAVVADDHHQVTPPHSTPTPTRRRPARPAPLPDDQAPWRAWKPPAFAPHTEP